MSEHTTDNRGESTVMGVTKDSIGFVRATQLLECEWCGNTGLHPEQVAAVKPKNHAVMMCSDCMPEPTDVDYDTD